MTRPPAKDAWHGSAALRDEVLRQVEHIEAAGEIHPIDVDGQALQLTGSALPLARAFGWPTDLLALCLTVFHDGLLDDPLGIQQWAERLQTFLKVPRPGADLRAIFPEIIAHRLTEEAWLAQCSPEVQTLLETVALQTLEGSDTAGVRAEAEEMLLKVTAIVREQRSTPGTEGRHYERRALRWSIAVLDRDANPDALFILSEVQAFDFSKPLPVPGERLPPDYFTAELARLEALQQHLLGLLASAPKAGSGINT